MGVLSCGSRIVLAIAGFSATARGGGSGPRTTIASNMNGGSAPKIAVRAARVSESSDLTIIINSCFRHYAAYFNKDGQDRVTADGKQVEQLISAPCSAVLVAEELNSDGTASTMLGCVQADWSGVTDSGDPGIDACFGKLSVPEEFSRRGVGKLLVSSAEQLCRKELGRENILVEITVFCMFPELFAWYESQGYKMGRVIPFPVPEIVLEGCDLGLQLMTKNVR